MNSAPSEEIVRFGVFEANVTARELRKGGTKIRLQDQPFRVLAVLLERPGEVVTREELRERLWPEDTFVGFDQSLNTCIKKIRRVLSDSAETPRCVETLPKVGYRFIHPMEGAARPAAAEGKKEEKRRRPSVMWVVSAVAVVATAMVFWALRTGDAPQVPLRRFALTPVTRVESSAVSPDGSHVVYSSGSDLWIWDFSQEKPSQLTDGDPGARYPFWSPDGESIGFMAGESLMRVRFDGGPSTRICELPSGFVSGGCWSPDGESIIISTFVKRMTLYEVAASGGEPRAVVNPQTGEAVRLTSPSFVPLRSGRRVLLAARNMPEDPHVVFHNLDTGEQTDLAAGEDPAYSPTGHVLYQQTGMRRGIWALPVSLKTLQVTGEPFPVAESGRGPTVAQGGTLVYRDLAGNAERKLVLRDRAGRILGTIGSPQDFIAYPIFSPDGKSVVATGNESAEWGLWIHSVDRPVKRRLTHDRAYAAFPVWSPDGKLIAYQSMRNGPTDIFVKRADGTGEATALTNTPAQEMPHSWSPDGKKIFYSLADPETPDDLWYLDCEGAAQNCQPKPFLQTKFPLGGGRISPDGRYLAYASRESDRSQIVVREFPGGEGRVQVSLKGGSNARWRRDGAELFYGGRGKGVVSVPVTTEPRFEILGAEQAIPNVRGQWDVTADGQRFVTTEVADPSRPPFIRAVQNWHAEFEGKE